ncbi:MAG TPA: hypothetical protein VFX96_02310 [Pyrinomonadaceae bacterium]|nr:hypothetical protein [Pyrinomonadaceae bacterium]
MSLTRRKFLSASAHAALFAALPLTSLDKVFAQQDQPGTSDMGPQLVGGLYEVPQEAKLDNVFYFTQSTFDPHLNTDFSVRAGVLASTLRLVDIEACPSARDVAASDKGECFSLMFRADRELSRARTIHVFEHGALGAFNLFVTPTTSKSDPRGLYYVAVINHRVTAGAPAAPKTIKPRQTRPSSQ